MNGTLGLVTLSSAWHGSMSCGAARKGESSASTTTTLKTDDGLSARSRGSTAPEPGLLLVFSAGRPRCEPIQLGADPIALGRDHTALGGVPDRAMSRRHAQVTHDAGHVHVTDLGSRNGSALDGEPLHGGASTHAARLLRLGHSLFLLCPDLGPIRRLGVEARPERVEGPALKRALLSVAKAASLVRTLFISGESGSGKEHFARAFHQAGPQREGPFVTVNCATIPEGIAERLLFGAVKGAYSGATNDSEGYVHAADGGTLFFDEVGDLDAAVQAKLLRVLESGEVSPLGATRPRRVNMRVVCATCKDLRRLVAAGKFRADLYFRIAVPEVSVPPLRERLEEIPWLITSAVSAARADLVVHASLVEACLLRPWPGNVRELLAEINTAVIAALVSEGAMVAAEHLRPPAGLSLAGTDEIPAVPMGADTPSGAGADPEALRERLSAMERQTILNAIEACGGNQTRAAGMLGISRRTLVARLTEWGVTRQRRR